MNIVLIKKTGLLTPDQISQSTLKNIDFTLENITSRFGYSEFREILYKKCGYKKVCDDQVDEDKRLPHFGLLWTYKHNNSKYVVYGKVSGRSGMENKYELPPPVDEELYFGTLVIIKLDNENNMILNLDLQEWKETYNALYGGFEDLESEEEESEDDNDEINYTADGYEKDGFVVDDEELQEEEYYYEDE